MLHVAADSVENGHDSGAIDHVDRIPLARDEPEGLAYAAKHKRLSESDVKAISTLDPALRLRSRKDGATEEAPTPAPPPADPEKSSPEERIDEAIQELRDSVARDLLEIIGRAAPEFFEKLVLELLHKMGYGTSRADVQRVGGSGDEGIDGIISLDRLGLEKVYIQAKRWKKPIGSPEIQGFMGALQLQGAAKGVFVTTSSFTKDAKQASAKARGTIVLVDGERLSELMIDNRVGVTSKVLSVPKVDNEFFDEE